MLSFWITGSLARPFVLSHGSGISPNMSRMNRPSAIVDIAMRELIAKLSIASSNRPALW